MYIVKNVVTGKTVLTADTKLEVLLAQDPEHHNMPMFYRHTGWVSPFGVVQKNPVKMKFTELNITGKDIKPCANFLPRWDGSKMEYIQIANKPTELRRYQVLDENGPVDIRTWEKEIGEVIACDGNPRPSNAAGHDAGFRKDPCGNGAKNLFRRATCSAMWKQNLAEQAFSRDTAEDMAVVAPVIDRTKPRKRGIYAADGMPDYAVRALDTNNCWKRQKGAKQWGKHEKVKRSGLNIARALKASSYSLEDVANCLA